MKKTVLLIVNLLLMLTSLTGCGNGNKMPPADYEKIMKNVCLVNNIPYVNEADTVNKGDYEIILCGKVEILENFGPVLVPDDERFEGYTWPWKGNEVIGFNSTVMFDQRGNMFDYSDQDELIGRNIMLICQDRVGESYPGTIFGQRVTVVLDK